MHYPLNVVYIDLKGKKKSFIKLFLCFLLLNFTCLFFLSIRKGFENILSEKMDDNVSNSYISVDVDFDISGYRDLPYIKEIDVIETGDYYPSNKSTSFYIDGESKNVCSFIDFFKMDEIPKLWEEESKINKSIVSGRMPINDDEITISENFAKILGFNNVSDVIGHELSSKSTKEYSFVNNKIVITDKECEYFRYKVVGVVSNKLFEVQFFGSIGTINAILPTNDKQMDNVDDASLYGMKNVIYLKDFQSLSSIIKLLSNDGASFSVMNEEVFTEIMLMEAENSLINKVLLIILISILVIVIINIVFLLNIKWDNEASTLNLLRSIGYGKKQCNCIFEIEVLIIDLISFVIGGLLAIGAYFLASNLLSYIGEHSLKLTVKDCLLGFPLVLIIGLVIIETLQKIKFMGERNEKD